MAYITKNDIVNGAVITEDFFKRIIEALDGTNNIDIKIGGELQVSKDKLKIDGTTVNTTAAELNGLANRTAGVVEANKPVVVGANKDINYLKVQQLQVDELISSRVDVGGVGGKIYAFKNFI